MLPRLYCSSHYKNNRFHFHGSVFQSTIQMLFAIANSKNFLPKVSIQYGFQLVSPKYHLWKYVAMRNKVNKYLQPYADSELQVPLHQLQALFGDAVETGNTWSLGISNTLCAIITACLLIYVHCMCVFPIMPLYHCFHKHRRVTIPTSVLLILLLASFMQQATWCFLHAELFCLATWRYVLSPTNHGSFIYGRKLSADKTIYSLCWTDYTQIRNYITHCMCDKL